MTDVVDKLLFNSYSTWYRLLPNNYKEFIITMSDLNTSNSTAEQGINSFNSITYTIYQSVGAL